MSDIKKIKIKVRSSEQVVDIGASPLNIGASPLKMCDLFSGTGAFSLAFKNVFGNGVDIVFANDVLEHSKKIYNQQPKLNTGHFVVGDIHNIDANSIPNFDLLTGGFSCQGFSIAGKQLGFADPRSNTFWKIMDIVDKKQPQFLLLENVSNLVSHDHGKTFKIICDNITDRGYNITYRILDTCKITGIPQHRERIYIFCYKQNQKQNQKQPMLNNLLDFPEIEQQPLSDFLQSDDDTNLTKYYYTDKSVIYPKLIQSVVKQDTMYQYRRTYVRENKSGVVPTLTNNMGTGGHTVAFLLDTKGIRKLTPRECFNFQGFPSDYNIDGLSDSKLYQLAGNAVTYKVVEMIATKLKLILNIV